MTQAPPAERVEQRIRIAPDGHVVALSGKVEFGQKIRTAFARIVADEMDVPFERVEVVLGDTDVVPFDQGTFGSMSVANDGAKLRRAAAYARELLAAGRPVEGDVPADVPLRGDAAPRTSSIERIEARAIVTGTATYTADVRLPGMARAAVVRPPLRSARLRAVDDRPARGVPGVIDVVRDGDLLAVVAERDAQATAAARVLDPEWETSEGDAQGTQEIVVKEDGDVAAAMAAAATRFRATYTMPYISNAPIGPSAAVADVRPDGATVYAGTQRPFGLRDEVAAAVGLAAERVRVVPQMPSGTYGRNSLGDAAIEAARISKAAGRPILLQWSREEEFAFGPARPACALEIEAALDEVGRIVAWTYDEHTNAHGAGGARDIRVAPFTSGRNAVPPYDVGALRVRLFIEPSELRTASFRSLAAAENVFAIESAMDELARTRGEDPLAFRLRHARDDRLRAVLEAVAAASGWPGGPGWNGAEPPARSGLGLACTLYAHGTYVAQVARVAVERSGRVRVEKVWCAIDPGAVIDVEGVRNQSEGAIVQSTSWTLYEELRQRGGRVSNASWDTYPIATFLNAPDVEILVIGRSDQQSTGIGEPPAVPVAAAIANAVHAATGKRVRDLPLRRV